MMTLKQEVTQLHADLCAALADTNRLLILYALAERPHNVGELTERLGVPQPTTSRHLKTLRERGLVYTQRQGSTVIYTLSDKRLIEALNLLHTVLRDRIARRANLMEDIS